MGRLSHYVASKWGLVGLTKSWAIELAPYNIRVVALCPTGVNTPMNDGLAMLEGKTSREIAERSAGNLLPMPWIEPEDVAEAVVFLASSRRALDHRLGVHPRRGIADALRAVCIAPNHLVIVIFIGFRNRWLLPAILHERDADEAVEFLEPRIEIRHDRLEQDAAFYAAHSHAVAR